jgi:hypothetical protein
MSDRTANTVYDLSRVMKKESLQMSTNDENRRPSMYAAMGIMALLLSAILLFRHGSLDVSVIPGAVLGGIFGLVLLIIGLVTAVMQWLKRSRPDA